MAMSFDIWDEPISGEQKARYLNAVYHARVFAAAQFLQDWDFRQGAGEDFEFYAETAMRPISVLDELPLPPSITTSGGAR
jgi:hypothetical protein